MGHINAFKHGLHIRELPKVRFKDEQKQVEEFEKGLEAAVADRYGEGISVAFETHLAVIVSNAIHIHRRLLVFDRWIRGSQKLSMDERLRWLKVGADLVSHRQREIDKLGLSQGKAVGKVSGVFPKELDPLDAEGDNQEEATAGEHDA